MRDFLRLLETQRWDDHRYYHHSRVNQTLHLISAISFLCAYMLLFKYPVAASLIGWLVAMGSRQIGHFFFEPRGYDEVNHASHEYKEAIKVGYNLQRKSILLLIWVLSPLLIVASPSLFGIFDYLNLSQDSLIEKTALLWLAVGGFGLIFRTVHLFFLQGFSTGLVWLTKILSDPFHDIKIYYRSPVYLLRGEWIDPMTHTGSMEETCTEQHA